MRRVAAAVTVVAALGLAACGHAEKRPGSTVAVTSTDSACQVARTDLPAGSYTFAVSNKGSKVTEFYVYGAGDKIVGEVENVGPGTTRELTVELAAGEYRAACKPGMKGDGIRVALRVSGQAPALADDPKLAAAVASYQAYVAREADGLLADTTAFVTAVKAGDVARAKQLYPVARTHWERIEPVAESFGDLDAAIDAREDGVEAGTEWTGFHRLEKDLWVTGSVAAGGPVADRLLADVTGIVAKAKSVTLSPTELANGSKELLDEVATGKITGEEERYSRTDLWDFAANVEGAKKAVESLRDALVARDPALVSTLDQRFATVDSVLGRHRAGTGWKSYPELSGADLKELSDAVNALSEPVSRVGAAVVRR
jgi:iron uptake system component EfeO